MGQTQDRELYKESCRTACAIRGLLSKKEKLYIHTESVFKEKQKQKQLPNKGRNGGQGTEKETKLL